MDDSKTQEGGLIQALINMQIKPRIKDFLPSFSKVFSNDAKQSSELDCYGIHLYVPEMQYFKGGFMIKGNYKQVPVNKASCLEG